ncbi:MAG TPA: T9SS type A sorting domain-containing protein [Saprospiraceae bacterium]|nr:T9SS type A sorting domain-containing protein [Saprospiraceae bacterium]HMQ84407.1 T9SS type A sorting domain-containing protein [Saprospiraceae bacterium]
MKKQPISLCKAIVWIRLACIYLLAFFLHDSATAQFLFFPPKTIIGDALNVEDPRYVHFADLDGDGDLDVLSASEADSNVSWYENLDGQGHFSAQKYITTETYARVVIPADMDNDGDIDVVTGAAGRITWRKNLGGASTFGGTQFLNAGDPNDVRSICVADFDGDGDQDIAEADGINDNVVWYEHANGSDAFNQEHLVQGGLPTPNHISVGDIDGDGDLDLLSGGFKLAIWHKNIDGQGNFSQHDTIYYGQTALIKSINTADFDSDGDLDVIIAIVGDKISWFENTDGQGHFGSEQIVSTDLTWASYAIGADVDSDGDQDVIGASFTDGKIRWYENTNGQGSFGPQHIITALAKGAETIQAADVDGDGDLDVLSSSVNDEKIAWYRNQDGNGSFGPQQIISSRVREGKAVDVADLDGDGDPDVLSASYAHDRIAWYNNLDGAGSFSKQIILSDNAQGARDAKTADLDGDGDLDVVSSSHYYFGGNNTHKLAWYENLDGQALFGGQHVISSDTGSVKLHLADIDSDGDPDILYRNLGEMAWFENINGSNDFLPHQLGQEDSYTFFPADVDGDQDMDILFSIDRIAGDTLKWMKNLDGQGHFGDPIFISDHFIYPGSMQTTDIDGDGDPDLLVLSYEGLYWFENKDALGTFGPPRLILQIYNISDVSPTDFDNDGDPDLAVSSGGAFDTRLHRIENRDGYGTFGPPRLFTSNQQVYIEDLSGADLNQDGYNDLLAINSFGDHQLSWFTNAIGSAIPMITGTCYFDQNQNQVKDPGETGLLNQQVDIAPQAAGFTNLYGTFQFQAPFGNYTVSATPAEHWQLTTALSSYQIVNSNSAEGLDFGFYPILDTTRVQPVVSSNATRCGFSSLFWVDYSNQGTVYSDGYLGFTFDTLTSLIYAVPEPDSTNGHSIFWRFEHLPPSYGRGFQVLLQMPDVTHLGDTVHFTAKTYVGHADELEENEIYNYASVINCSYDPNDKLVNPAGVGSEGFTLIGEELEFTIRFQNTGTDTAFTVRIEDQLDPDLDWTSFRPVASSFPCITTLNEEGLLTFLFKSIYLPDSTTNEPASHGFLKYRIKPLPGIASGTVIENTASIFFDNNPAVITTTTTNTMTNELPLLISLLPPNCHGGSDGQIVAQSLIGVLPITYSLQGVASNQNGVFSNLTAGQYTLTAMDAAGVSATYELVLENPPLLLTALDASICMGDSYEFGDMILTKPGIYTATLNSQTGCDSIVELNLQTLDLPVFSLGVDTIICETDLPFELNPGAEFDSYLWNDGSTGQSITLLDASLSGTYALTVTDDNDCTASDEITITITTCVASDEVNKEGNIRLFPNPARGMVYLQLEGSASNAHTIRMQNALGQLLWSSPVLASAALVPIPLSGLPDGTYFLFITAENWQKVVKLMVE